MRSLRLDFLHPFPRPHAIAWLLLAAGLGLSVWVGWKDQQVGRALAAASAAAPAPKTLPAARRAAAPTGTEPGAAESSRAQLSTPWGDLFIRLESHRPKQIALLAGEESPAPLWIESAGLQTNWQKLGGGRSVHPLPQGREALSALLGN